MAQINFDRGMALTQQLAETESIDLPNTIMRLEMQKVGYEAALSATAKAIQPTLHGLPALMSVRPVPPSRRPRRLPA